MKLSLTSILLTSGLVALCANAGSLDEDAAVFYAGSDAVGLIDHKSCIPLKSADGLNVNEVTFGVQVTCNLYKSNDCSGPAEENKQKVFKLYSPVLSEYFGYLGSNGSLKCN